jgi:hypothetical protein
MVFHGKNPGIIPPSPDPEVNLGSDDELRPGDSEVEGNVTVGESPDEVRQVLFDDLEITCFIFTIGGENPVRK